MTKDLDAELEAWDEEYAETWRPRVGQRLVGTVRRYTEVGTEYGDTWVATIATEDGEEWSVWLSQTVLKGAFVKLRPKVGERVGIKRLEDRKGGRGAYKNYAVVVDREPEKFPSVLAGEDDGEDTRDYSQGYVDTPDGAGAEGDGGFGDWEPSTDVKR